MDGFYLSCGNEIKNNVRCNNEVYINKSTLKFRVKKNFDTGKKTKEFYVVCEECGNEIIISEKLIDNETKRFVIKKARQEELKRMDEARKQLAEAIDEYIAEK